MADRLDEIRTRLEGATLGPWVARHDTDAIRVVTKHEHAPHGEFCIVHCAYHSDADFIAHAHADIAWMLNQLAHDREFHAREVAELRDALESAVADLESLYDQMREHQ